MSTQEYSGSDVPATLLRIRYRVLNRSSLFHFLLLWCFMISSTLAESLPFQDRDLVGIYQTQRCASGREWGVDPRNALGLFFQRAYYFHSDHRFEVNYVFFADDRCATPQFAVLWEGRWQLGTSVPALSFTREGEFPIDRMRVAVLDNSLLEKTVMRPKHGWVIGLFKDVTSSGCTSLSPILAAIGANTVDYDVVSLQNGRLRTGLRNPAMTSGPAGRPAVLQDITAIRQ